MAPALTPLRIALLVVLAIALAAAGGVALLADEPAEPSAAAIDNASERMASLDGFSATLETSVRMNGEETRTVRRVVGIPGTGKYRSAAVDDSGAGADLTVSNGTVTWLYDADNGTVRRLSIDGAGNASGVLTSGSYVERLLKAAFDETNDSASEVSALPMVSSRGRSAPSGSVPANGTDVELNVSYAGTERVSGRETYVLELTQPDPGRNLENYSARVWIDTEWFVVLRQRTNFTVEDTRYVSATRYRNVTFDPDLEDVSFRFDPDEHRDVRTVTGPTIERYDSRDALAGNASMPVPDPELPGDFRFDQGAHTTGTVRSVTLQYTNGSTSMSVTVRNGTGGTSEGSRVRVGETTGRLQTLGATTLVNWECAGHSYTVIGANLSNETVIDVAESVGCE